MAKKHIEILSNSLNIKNWQVSNTLNLLNEGATVPFISRYRKELTGTLDEVQVLEIKEQYEKLLEIDSRRATIIKSIEEQGKLTDELLNKLNNTYILSELEDIYLPYKQKRKTRSSIAKEKGLEPLAMLIFKQQVHDIELLAKKYINDEVPTIKEALQGARDIICEWVNEDQRARNNIRGLFGREAVIYSKVIKGKDQDGIKYKDYFDYSEPLNKCPSHRILAMRRGESEGFLKITVEPSTENAINILLKQFITGNSDSSAQVKEAIEDSYKRLLGPSIENEIKGLSKEKADTEAIRVFAENLRQLLLSSPLGQKTVLAIDPGYRTGCKIVCLDEQGTLLHNETIYPHPPQNESGMAMKKLSSLVSTYKIEAIAIGNGTASRETEQFILRIQFDRKVQVFVVSENGASVYSASPVAREEFPDYDVTVRGAISIGRRLMDPLAELVKIEPKSIGVGQYQHDVDQNRLKSGLDSVVESCVNMVGVNLNTASKHLLTYVSGLGPQLAANIVSYRLANGPFASRMDLKKVPRLGDKAFEQCAGFLRISNANNPLDNSAVHPESYKVVEQMAYDLDTNVSELIKSNEYRDKIDLKRYISGNIGLPTLQDILQELSKPGRDPRTIIQVFEFSREVFKIEDVKQGMVLPGIVTNITNFGCFVDIGVKQDGLVHISELADRYIKDPNEIVKLNQHVKVKVLNVDAVRKRIQLSMKE